MIRLTTENTQNAIKRCKQLKPRVKYIKDRLFVVYSANNSNVYHVNFDVSNGEKLGQCECKASERGLVCYHLVAGATANIYRQGINKAQKH
jgi:signal transduction histidine kinase